jgi:hypothetical protein
MKTHMNSEIPNRFWPGRKATPRRDTYSINLIMRTVSQVEHDRVPLIGRVKPPRALRIPRSVY